jgi:hypothetical protein
MKQSTDNGVDFELQEITKEISKTKNKRIKTLEEIIEIKQNRIECFQEIIKEKNETIKVLQSHIELLKTK